MVPVGSLDQNQITVATIAGSIPGRYDVMVMNPDGGRAILSNGFSYTAPTPTIYQLIPDLKIEAEDPFQLIIHGEDFIPGTMAYWGGSSRVTQTIDSSHLKASISTFDILEAKTVQVQV